MEGRLGPCRRRLTTRGPLGRLQFANQERGAGYPQSVGKQLCPRARTRHMQTRGLPACPRHPNTVTPLSSRRPEEAGTRSTPGSQDSSRCTSAKMRMAHGGGARGCPHKPERAGPRLAHRQPAARTPSGAVRGRAGAGPPVPPRLRSPAPAHLAPRPRASQTPRSPPRAARLAPTPPRTARAPSAASSTDGQGGAGLGRARLETRAGGAGAGAPTPVGPSGSWPFTAVPGPLVHLGPGLQLELVPGEEEGAVHVHVGGGPDRRRRLQPHLYLPQVGRQAGFWG